MKKVLLAIALCAVMLAGCEPRPKPNTVPHEPQERSAIGWEDVMYERFELDGHTYIKFYQGISGYHDCCGYEHDPECLKRDLKEWGYGAE